MIPEPWLPKADIRRIHQHWTGGARTASALDRRHYHMIREAVSGGGTNLARGDHSVTDNAHPIRSGRSYAAHTRAANSGALGYSLAGMAGAVERPLSVGRHPIRLDQWQDSAEDIAQIVERYGIAVTDKTVLTHAEVQENLGIAQRGKWDIAVLPFDLSVRGARAIGDRLRDEVLTLRRGGSLGRKVPVAEAGPKKVDAVTIPQLALRGVVTASWLRLRDAPDGRIIGGMPSGTPVTIIDHDRGWAEIVTPKGHRGFAAFNFIALETGA